MASAQEILEKMEQTQEKMLRTMRALADEIQNAPDEDAIPFKRFFRIGDLVQVIRQSSTNNVLITYASRLADFRVDFGQISARNDSNEVTGLNMGSDRMAQFRFSPITEFRVEVDNPAGIQQGRGATQRYTIPPWRDAPGMNDAQSATHELNSQFWVWENDTPRFNLIPLVATTWQLEAYADFWGVAYDFIEVDDLPSPQKEAAQAQIADGNFRVFRLNGRPASA